jgi:hypothetical protein
MYVNILLFKSEAILFAPWNTYIYFCLILSPASSSSSFPLYPGQNFTLLKQTTEIEWSSDRDANFISVYGW